MKGLPERLRERKATLEQEYRELQQRYEALQRDLSLTQQQLLRVGGAIKVLDELSEEPAVTPASTHATELASAG